MKKTNIIIIIIMIFASFMLSTQLNAFGWWGEKQKPTQEDIIQNWQKKQADSPSDPYINYNLGVALYKTGKFGPAETNFDRASITANDQELKKRCFFNLGNSFYQDVLTSLPENWLTADISAENLDAAIAKVKGALKKYESVLMLDKQHQPTKINKKAAQELLEKLEKKKQQESKKDKKDNKDKENKQNENDKDKEQKESQQQPGEQNRDQQEQQKSQPKQESMEKRGGRALLDDVQNDESKLQKALILKKLKAEGKPQESSQRPW